MTILLSKIPSTSFAKSVMAQTAAANESSEIRCYLQEKDIGKSFYLQMIDTKHHMYGKITSKVKERPVEKYCSRNSRPNPVKIHVLA